MVLSLTFRELGKEAISSGRVWFTCAVIRSTVVGEVVGAWSACLWLFLDRLLLGPAGCATAGCPVAVAGTDRLLFARVTNLLSDGDGLRQALDWKGASGLKPCFKHFNVLKKDN